MALPEELLALAEALATGSGAAPDQATLRRAASTAYYALFHLLITEATANWARPELRTKLGRCFDHGPMRTACEARFSDLRNALRSQDLAADQRSEFNHLLLVTATFVTAQQWRNQADYNLAGNWASVEVLLLIRDVRTAFTSWSAIRESASAQDFLVSLIGLRDRRPADLQPAAAMLSAGKSH